MSVKNVNLVGAKNEVAPIVTPSNEVVNVETTNEVPTNEEPANEVPAPIVEAIKEATNLQNKEGSIFDLFTNIKATVETQFSTLASKEETESEESEESTESETNDFVFNMDSIMMDLSDLLEKSVSISRKFARSIITVFQYLSFADKEGITILGKVRNILYFTYLRKPEVKGSNDAGFNLALSFIELFTKLGNNLVKAGKLDINHVVKYSLAGWNNYVSNVGCIASMNTTNSPYISTGTTFRGYIRPNTFLGWLCSQFGTEMALTLSGTELTMLSFKGRTPSIVDLDKTKDSRKTSFSFSSKIGRKTNDGMSILTSCISIAQVVKWSLGRLPFINSFKFEPTKLSIKGKIVSEVEFFQYFITNEFHGSKVLSELLPCINHENAMLYNEGSFTLLYGNLITQTKSVKDTELVDLLSIYATEKADYITADSVINPTQVL